MKTLAEYEDETFDWINRMTGDLFIISSGTIFGYIHLDYIKGNHFWLKFKINFILFFKFWFTVVKNDKED